MGKNNQKLSIDFVSDIFRENDCILISKEYVNARTPLEYVCSCGTRSFIRYDNFRQGKRCNNCRYKKIAEKRRHSFDFIKKEFLDGKCKLLSDSYKNGKTPLKYKCECGNIAYITYSSFKEGHRCEVCRVRKISGENSPHFKPHLTEEHRLVGRNSKTLREWRKKVFERDDYICFKCNKRGGELNAHHINSYGKYPKQREVVTNGLTLCEICHKDFHDKYGYGDNDVTQLIDWMK